MGNSSFLPSSATIQKWSEETPHGFHFTLKLPQYIVEKRYGGNKDIGEFLEFKPLKDMILCVAISPPKTLSLIEGGREWIENTLNGCTYHGYTVVFDFSQSLWHQDLTYNILRKYDSSFVGSDTGSNSIILQLLLILFFLILLTIRLKKIIMNLIGLN